MTSCSVWSPSVLGRILSAVLRDEQSPLYSTVVCWPQTAQGKWQCFWLGKCSAPGNCPFDSLQVLSCCAAKKKKLKTETANSDHSPKLQTLEYFISWCSPHSAEVKLWKFPFDFVYVNAKWKSIWYGIWRVSFRWPWTLGHFCGCWSHVKFTLFTVPEACLCIWPRNRPTRRKSKHRCLLPVCQDHVSELVCHLLAAPLTFFTVCLPRVGPHLSSPRSTVPFASAFRVSFCPSCLCVSSWWELCGWRWRLQIEVWSGQHSGLRGKRMFFAAEWLNGKCRRGSGNGGTDDVRLFSGCGEEVIPHLKKKVMS